MNNLDIDTVVSSFCPFRKGSVDVLLFNPPYVVTPPEEVGKRDDISAAWAGGINGRQVIDELLPLVNGILSDDGVFYMVVINENKPLEILEEIKEYGLVGSVCFRRKAGIEGLSVLRITKMRS
jgi:release factor glutamine methyltransferase